jgi:hypothetical protein
MFGDDANAWGIVNMARRKTAAKGKPGKSDPGLRVRFLRVALRKRIAEGEQVAEIPPAPPDILAMGLGPIANQLRRYLWCRHTEWLLDDLTKFVRDHATTLTESEKNELEKGIAELLDAYTQIC